MSDSFDPYRVWLGIPPESRPPTHYELLGISPKERERAVIEAAMLRQSGYVRNFQIGKYAKEAARILNEIAAAKACLVDKAKRADYDAELKARQPAAAPAANQLAPHDTLGSAGALEPLVPASLPLLGDLLTAPVGDARPLAARRLARRSLRDATLKKTSYAPWQPLGAFGLGVALTLIAVAVWARRPLDERGEPPSLVGTLSLEASSPPPTLQPPLESTKLRTEAATIIPPPPDVRTPQVLEIKTQTYSWPGLAQHEDDAFYVGLGSDFGSSAVGYRLKGVRKVAVQINSIGTLRRMDDGFFGGFLVDYHTPAGYERRVGLCVGQFNDKWQNTVPDWGAHVAASQFIDLTRQFAFNEQEYLKEHPDVAAAVNRRKLTDGQHHWEIHGKYEGRDAQFGTSEPQELDLEEWAPHDWDGDAWFSVAISNAGTGAHIEGRLIDPVPPSIEKSPGEFRRLTGHTDSVTALAFLPNGRLLSGSFDTTWAVWDARNGIAAQRFPTELGNETAVRAVAVSSGDTHGLPALISNVNRVNHFDLLTGKLLHRLNGHTDGVRCLAISRDGKRAVSGGVDFKAHFWNLDTGQQLWERDLAVYSVAISPDGNRIVLGIHCKERDPIRVFDAAGNQISSVMCGEDPVIGISLSPDGKRCLANQGPAIKLFDLESGAEQAQFLPARGNGSKPVFSPDGRYAAWGGDVEFVLLWDIESRTMVAEFEHAPLGTQKRRRHDQDWMPVAFSPDGALLASGADDGTIYLWNVPKPPAEETAETIAISREGVATERGRFVPLDLSHVATIVSTQGMFHGKDTNERMIFDDWSPKTFEGVPFQLVDPQGERVPNVVMLYGPNGALPPTMPTSVSLACNASARAIHFLSGVSGWGAQRAISGGTVSMVVRLRYADGKTEDHPLRDGEHFANYIGRFDVPKSKFAFMLRSQQLRYLAVYPKRREPIEQIDLVKGPDCTAPIVMAITVEGQ